MNADYNSIIVIKRSCCIFLAGTILLTQFGCASIPMPTPPAVIKVNEPSAIASVPADSMNYQTFHGKIAELKGKIQTFHANDRAFFVLRSGVDSADMTQNDHEVKNSRVRGKAALWGAIVPGTLTLGIGLYGLSQTSNDGCPETNAIIGMASLAILAMTPVVSLIGSLISFTGAAIIQGPDVTMVQQQELRQLIGKYNGLNAPAYVPQIQDTLK